MSLCFANSKAYLTQWTVSLGSQNIPKKLTLFETLDIKIRITGTVSGTSWSTTSREIALGVEGIARVDKDKPLQEKQLNIHIPQPTKWYESFKPGI